MNHACIVVFRKYSAYRKSKTDSENILVTRTVSFMSSTMSCLLYFKEA